jgi:hypothetical protein
MSKQRGSILYILNICWSIVSVSKEFFNKEVDLKALKRQKGTRELFLFQTKKKRRSRQNIFSSLLFSSLLFSSLLND